VVQSLCVHLCCRCHVAADIIVVVDRCVVVVKVMSTLFFEVVSIISILLALTYCLRLLFCVNTVKSAEENNYRFLHRLFNHNFKAIIWRVKNQTFETR